MVITLLILLGVGISVLFAEISPGLSKPEGRFIGCLIGGGYAICVLVSNSNIAAICIYIGFVAVGTLWPNKR